ncbi:MAG: hypothetical protein QNJ45_05850 [Ardenticatenaceae bacterium]|nr:hypothetical protein [Ardenticatenaceae bacterium]
MIKLQAAKKLKELGLKWEPKLHDFFAIPERNLDDRIFVLSDMTIAAEVLHGYPALTFNGAVEWSLDFIYQFDVIWIPREDQLRTILVAKLAGGEEPIVQLLTTLRGYVCKIRLSGQEHQFPAGTAGDAYAAALTFVLEADQ